MPRDPGRTRRDRVRRDPAERTPGERTRRRPRDDAFPGPGEDDLRGPGDDALGGPPDEAVRAPKRDAARPKPDPAGLRAGPAARWIGTLSATTALTVFFGAAVIGAVVTLITDSGPGGLLGTLIILGVVIAALGIERRSLYRLIPMPALTYLVLAIVTGAVHDRQTDGSTAGLGLGFLQWIGNGFLSVFTATLLVLLIFGARLLTSRQLVSGSFPMTAQRAAAGRPAPAFAAPNRRSAPRRERPAPGPDERPARRRDTRRQTVPPDDGDAWHAPRDREPRKDPHPRPNSRRPDSPRPDSPRPDGPRPDGPRADGPRPDDRRMGGRRPDVLRPKPPDPPDPPADGPRPRLVPREGKPAESKEPPTLTDPPAVGDPRPRGRDSRGPRDGYGPHGR